MRIDPDVIFRYEMAKRAAGKERASVADAWLIENSSRSMVTATDLLLANVPFPRGDMPCATDLYIRLCR